MNSRALRYLPRPVKMLSQLRFNDTRYITLFEFLHCLSKTNLSPELRFWRSTFCFCFV